MWRPSSPQLRARLLFSTQASAAAAKPQPQSNRPRREWSVKQVTKSNFENSLEDFKRNLSSSQFVSVSLQKTGSYSAPWHRVAAFDTHEIAYLKSKYAAERFEVLHFAVCPFSIDASKVTAYPYNFHLFPRDELKLGMPSYAFACQTSVLTSMGREGFDFNSCIYDGISYLSRVQEPQAKIRRGGPYPSIPVTNASVTPSIADNIFVERIRSRLKQWKQACKESSLKTDEGLISSLRRLVLGTEEYMSRPCMNIDVCSERQVQLVLKMVGEFSEFIPLIIPAKGGGTQAVRVVLTSSKEDKDILEKELHSLEEEENKKIRGFREVIELISASHRPVISHDSLNDFTLVHSRFLAPLPSKVDEFMNSLHLVFPYVLDVNHLIKEISPLKKGTNMTVAISYLKNRFFAPIDMDVPSQDAVNGSRNHGHSVLELCHLFAKVCSILKVSSISEIPDKEHLSLALQEYVNIFNPFSSSPLGTIDEDDIRVWLNNTRKVSYNDVIFMWGFGGRVTAGMLKNMLQGSHNVFSTEFDVRMVENGCAIVVFWQPGYSEIFLNAIASDNICGSLREMVSEGLKAAGYEIYRRVCSLGLWEENLSDSLEKALAYAGSLSKADSRTNSSEIHWGNDSIINLDDL